MADVVLPINRTLVPFGGNLDVVFDPAALANWPDALEPDGLPAPTTTLRSLRLKLTARRPFTIADSTSMQVVDEPAGTTEWPGAWSNAAGALDPEPGIDYWRATNFDTSTGVYGWNNPYGFGSSSSVLSIASASDQWYGSADFDVSFRIERPNWLALGDASYERHVVGGPQFRVVLTPRPPNSANNFVTFRVTGIGNLQVSQTTLGAVDNVPIWIRCARSGGTLTISRSADGANWTTVATSSPGGSVSDPGNYTLTVGGAGGSFFNARYNIDGILSDLRYRVAGTLVADTAIPDAANTSATSWISTATGKTITRTGGTLLGGAVGTIEPRFTFTTPAQLSEFVLTLGELRSGEVLVEQIVLEAECGGGIYRDGRVHLS